jgi:hypothetical protein
VLAALHACKLPSLVAELVAGLVATLVDGQPERSNSSILRCLVYREGGCIGAQKKARQTHTLPFRGHEVSLTRYLYLRIRGLAALLCL